MSDHIQFSKFEYISRSLIEGFFTRTAGLRLEPQTIAAALARSMEESFYRDDSLHNIYSIYASRPDIEQLTGNNPTLEDLFSNFLLQLANQLDLGLIKPPHVLFQLDPSLASPQFRINSNYEEVMRPEQTEYYKPVTIEKAAIGAIKERDAFLIVDSILHVPLESPVVRIGRRQDNDIVLESKSVSRLHAQIRWRYNRFIIYDLGSRAGVLVNDEMVQEYVLKPGDVIRISHVTLIYGEGNTRPISPQFNADHNESTQPTKINQEINQDIFLTTHPRHRSSGDNGAPEG